METVRFGIVGIGNMGSVHAKSLYDNKIENAVLTCVCDIDENKRKWAESALNGVTVYEDYRKLLCSEKVDVVLIATPHYLHPIIAIEAFEHGLNVLTEKPAGVYIQKVKEMNAAAKKSGKAFGIMYNQRTNPIFKKAHDLIQSGELGELKRAVYIITNWYRRQEYYDSGLWRATWATEGGGVLINQCPHNIDIMQWIAGMPKFVNAKCTYGHYHDIEVEDDVSAFFEYENGATGALFTSTGENPGTNRLEISTDLAKIVIENGKLALWKYNISEREYRNYKTHEFDEKVRCEYSEFTEGEYKTSAHNMILQNFTNHILFDEELIAPGEDGINGLSISNAIHLSDWTGEKVGIPFDDEKHKKLLMERVKTSKPKKNVVTDSSVTAGNASSRWEVKW